MIKNITLSAEVGVIEQTQRLAFEEGMTLNKLFQIWLEDYVARPEIRNQYQILMKKLTHVRPGRRFSREEANLR